MNQTVRQYLVELEQQNPSEEPVHQQEQVSTTDPDATYLLSTLAFDYTGLGENFHRLFFIFLVLDEFWALSPLLLAYKIGLGLAIAATVALAFLPFSQRTLIRMGYDRES